MSAATLFACSSTDTYNCPPGQYYDERTRLCESQPAGCPAGQQWNGQACVAAAGCPAGQQWNGQACVAVGTPTCPAGQSWNGQACVQTGGTGFGTPTACTPAAPIDVSAAGMLTSAMPAIAAQSAVGGKPVGGPQAANFQPGQCLEMQVMMQPGKCYTAIGVGGGISELDIQLVPPVGPVFAEDKMSGPVAVLGQSPNCVQWAFAPMAMKLVMRATAGQGMAAVQFYEK
ncbi:MAG: hypothetical protein U0271_22990 [Polyangiaceae bacterium]